MAMTMPTQYLLQFFKLDDLPKWQHEVVQPFHDLAHAVAATYPANDDRDVCIRALIEAKDAALRSRSASNVPPYGV